MVIDDKIRYGKIQYDVNRKTVKISALSFRKINKYECLSGEEMLPSNRSQAIEQSKLSYSP